MAPTVAHLPEPAPPRTSRARAAHDNRPPALHASPSGASAFVLVRSHTISIHFAQNASGSLPVSSVSTISATLLVELLRPEGHKELCDAALITAADILDRRGQLCHQLAEAIRPHLSAEPKHRLPGAIELRGKEHPPVALGGFFREAARRLC